MMLKELDYTNRRIRGVHYKDMGNKVPRPLNATLNVCKYEREFVILPTVRESMDRFLSRNPNWQGDNSNAK
jgi:hypothetical protein